MTPTDDDTVSLALVDVIQPNYHQDRVVWSSAPAREVVGFDDAQAVRYEADTDEGILYARTLEVPVDGRGDPHARSINENRIPFPAADFETAFGHSGTDPSVEDLRLAVFATDDCFAFVRASDIATLDVDAEIFDRLE